jgi:uncharacterized protein (DUF433 family)
MNQKLLGRYIVTDPQICHGQPTFRGTRIMVKQVLEQVASGLAWEAIVEGLCAFPHARTQCIRHRSARYAG